MKNPVSGYEDTYRNKFKLLNNIKS